MAPPNSPHVSCGSGPKAAWSEGQAGDDLRRRSAATPESSGLRSHPARRPAMSTALAKVAVPGTAKRSPVIRSKTRENGYSYAGFGPAAPRLAKPPQGLTSR
ncbi:MAG TPA: hypothetical protein VF746_27430 [Longimicrobium sp.]